MESPDVPRSRKSRTFSSALTRLVKPQYPNTLTHNGRKESKTSVVDRASKMSPGGHTPSDGGTKSRPVSSTRDRINVYQPTGSNSRSTSSVALNEPLVMDFQNHYPTPPREYHPRQTSHLLQALSSEEDERPAMLSTDSSDVDDGSHTQRVVPRVLSQPPSEVALSRANSGRQLATSRRPANSRKQSAASRREISDISLGPSLGGPGDRSSFDSYNSQETAATLIHNLPALQSKGPDNSDAQHLEPLLEDDPHSFDLVEPPREVENVGFYAMEKRAEQMFSRDHLQTIFADPKLLLKFTGFLSSHRPQSIPLLIYYLDALKAMRAIRYANAIAEALEPIRGYDFSDDNAPTTTNSVLEDKASKAFDVMVREDLPAYIAHTWIAVVSTSIQRRVLGTLPPHLREASEGLAEVFCLTDPSRPDNPIVFASEEFARTTQYGMGYTIGRNCRFLQGPKTNPNSVRRLAQACQAGKEHTEVFVNYRRDGSPFMNLLMIAPLMDSRGNMRYYIGAQVDVSGLIKDCSELEGLARLVRKEEGSEAAAGEDASNTKDEFHDLSEMFNGTELDTVRRYGGRMHKEYIDDSDTASLAPSRRRLLLKDPSQDALDSHRDSGASSITSTALRDRINGKLEGVYQHYLLVRPAPSLRILFTSPSLRVPGILQSPFLSRIGGSARVRTDLAAALGEGRGVTAKIRWLSRATTTDDGQIDEREGRPRWIHCTPLVGHSGAVGVWMVVLVDEEGSLEMGAQARRFRPAPPVAANIGGKEWDGNARRGLGRANGNGNANAYDLEGERRSGGSNGAGRKEGEYFGAGDATSLLSGSFSGGNGNGYGSGNGHEHMGERTSRPVSVRRRSGPPTEFTFDVTTPSGESHKGTGYVS